MMCEACRKEIYNDEIFVTINIREGLLPKSSVNHVMVCAEEGCMRLFLEWD